MLYKKKLPLLLFLVPGILFLVVFLYFPFFENMKNALYDMNIPVALEGKPFRYIGFENFERLFTDPLIRVSLWNSFKLMFLTVIFQVGIGFVLAVMVSNIKRGQQFFRTVYFFPIVISATAIGLMFKLFYNYDSGMLNQILISMGLDRVKWLSESLAYTMICIPVLWSYVGFYFVILLTGLSDISDDVYEAASIDGCSKFRQVFAITLPMMRGVLCTCITLAVTGALKVFDLPWVIAKQGAPYGMTHFMGTYMYQTTFGLSDYDYGSVIAIVIVVFGVIVSKVVGRITRPDENL